MKHSYTLKASTNLIHAHSSSDAGWHKAPTHVVDATIPLGLKYVQAFPNKCFLPLYAWRVYETVDACVYMHVTPTVYLP